jgi:hypothetical protein
VTAVEKGSPALLHLAHRDIRVAAPADEAHPAAVFAEQVRARRDRSGHAAPRPEIVLLRRPETRKGGLDRSTRAGDRYDVTVQATLVFPLARLLQDRIVRQVESRGPAPSVAAPIARTLVRLLARTERVERTARRALVLGPATGPAGANRAEADVPMVMARRAVKDTPASHESPTSPQRARSIHVDAPPSRPLRLDDLPQGDLNRLTERVVKALDRRVIAHRERTGRA